MPPFVVLKHIKLSNLIKQKATNKGQLSQSRMSDQHVVMARVEILSRIVENV